MIDMHILPESLCFRRSAAFPACDGPEILASLEQLGLFPPPCYSGVDMFCAGDRRGRRRSGDIVFRCCGLLNCGGVYASSSEGSLCRGEGIGDGAGSI